jgi:hypothetical protein
LYAFPEMGFAGIDVRPIEQTGVAVQPTVIHVSQIASIVDSPRHETMFVFGGVRQCYSS